jgi:hypothetical protein
LPQRHGVTVNQTVLLCLCGKNFQVMKFHLYLFFLSLLFFVSPKISFATGDTLTGDTTKYALNDPRNPNCPCHDAQKKADEEYRKMIEKNNQANNNGDNPVNHDPVNNNGNNSNGNKSSDSTIATVTKSVSSGSGGSSKHYSKKVIEWKTMNKRMRKIKKSMIRKGKGTKRGKHRLVDCFHF